MNQEVTDNIDTTNLFFLSSLLFIYGTFLFTKACAGCCNAVQTLVLSKYSHLSSPLTPCIPLLVSKINVCMVSAVNPISL